MSFRHLESDIIMRDIHKYIRDLMAGPLLSDRKKLLRKHPIAFHYTTRIALSTDDDGDRAKNLGNRKTRFLL